MKTVGEILPRFFAAVAYIAGELPVNHPFWDAVGDGLGAIAT